MQQHTEHPTRRLMRLPEVMQRVGLKRSTIYKRMKEGGFPSQVKIGGAAGWFEDEINALLERLSAARDDVAVADAAAP